MKRFSDKYTKPCIFALENGVSNGWNAECDPGHAPSTGTCTQGPAVIAKAGDGFIDPEVLHQTERRSNLLTD